MGARGGRPKGGATFAFAALLAGICVAASVWGVPARSVIDPVETERERGLAAAQAEGRRAGKARLPVEACQYPEQGFFGSGVVAERRAAWLAGWQEGAAGE